MDAPNPNPPAAIHRHRRFTTKHYYRFNGPQPSKILIIIFEAEIRIVRENIIAIHQPRQLNENGAERLFTAFVIYRCYEPLMYIQHLLNGTDEWYLRLKLSGISAHQPRRENLSLLTFFAYKLFQGSATLRTIFKEGRLF